MGKNKKMFEIIKRISKNERERIKQEIDNFVWRKEKGEIERWIKRNRIEEMTSEEMKRIWKEEMEVEENELIRINGKRSAETAKKVRHDD